MAIDLPLEVKTALEGLQHKLRGVKWVGREQMHLTVRFIGESEVDVIAEALSGLSVPPFRATVSGGGTFPVRSKKPYVLWIGMHAKELATLRAQVDAALEGLVEPEEKPFHPHVTVARLRDADPKEVGQCVAALNALGERPFQVSTLRLYESHLEPHAARYEVQREYALR